MIDDTNHMASLVVALASDNRRFLIGDGCIGNVLIIMNLETFDVSASFPHKAIDNLSSVQLSFVNISFSDLVVILGWCLSSDFSKNVFFFKLRFKNR